MKIKSLFQKYILPHDVNFIEMLQNQSSATHKMVEDLYECFIKESEKNCKSILDDEYKTKALKNKNMEELLNAFITTIDRESIYRTITQLDWIAISIKHFVLETKAYKIDNLVVYQEMFNLILAASEALDEGFKSIDVKKHANASKFCDKTRDLTDKVSQQYIVEMVKLSNEKDIKKVFIYKEILTQLREIARRHHISANTLQDIVVKLD